MTYENEHEIDCGSLGKRLATVSFDYLDDTIFNEGVYISDFGWLGERLSRGIIDSLWQEIKGTNEYKEMINYRIEGL